MNPKIDLMQNPERTLFFLQQTALFGGLSNPQYDEILNISQLVKYEKDNFLFYQDDPAERIYVVIEGRIKLFQLGSDGQQVIMRVGTPGMMIAAISLVEGAVYPVSAQAAETSRLLAWRQADLLRVIQKYPPLALNALKVLSGHVREFQDRYRELATERVERRLARTVIRLAGQTGRKTDEGVLLDLPLTRQDLAEMCGTTLFTVSRILSSWEEKGLVHAAREKIVIIFLHGLVRIAEDLPGTTSPDEN